MLSVQEASVDPSVTIREEADIEPDIITVNETILAPSQAGPGRKTGCSPSRNTKKSEFPGPAAPQFTDPCSCVGARCLDPSGLLSPHNTRLLRKLGQK